MLTWPIFLLGIRNSQSCEWSYWNCGLL